MKLTTPMQITAADSESRTISGRIVAFNEAANASTGKVIFAKGSIQPKDVFLNLEHDRTRRIGKTLSMSLNSDKSIDATFKIANTTAGTDALVEAMDGLRDGFSVELAVNDYEMLKDGTMKITNADLQGVALTSEPAVRSARVTKVAATEENSEPTTVVETEPTTEGEKVSENTPEQSTTTESDVVATSVKATSIGMAYTTPRSPIINKVTYLEHFLKANVLGDEDSRIYVRAADNTTSTAPGMIPTPQSVQIINALANGDRGMIDALSREALVGEGMTFELPKVTAVPVVSNVPENTAVTESSLSATFLSVPVQSFKGRAITTVEFAYAKVTDEFAVGTIQAAGQQTGVNANTAAGFLAYTSQAAAAVYGSSLGFAQNLVVSPGQWANIMGYNDNGTPLYNAANPSNQAGLATAGSLRGRVSPGLDLYVSRSIGNAGATTSTGDFSMVTINPQAWTWYESPRFTLRTAIQSDGTVDLLYYGYAAIAPKIPFGAAWNQN